MPPATTVHRQAAATVVTMPGPGQRRRTKRPAAGRRRGRRRLRTARPAAPRTRAPTAVPAQRRSRAPVMLRSTSDASTERVDGRRRPWRPTTAGRPAAPARRPQASARIRVGEPEAQRRGERAGVAGRTSSPGRHPTRSAVPSASRVPPTSVATTGMPRASASLSTIPYVSAREGWTTGRRTHTPLEVRSDHRAVHPDCARRTDRPRPTSRPCPGRRPGSRRVELPVEVDQPLERRHQGVVPLADARPVRRPAADDRLGSLSQRARGRCRAWPPSPAPGRAGMRRAASPGPRAGGDRRGRPRPGRVARARDSGEAVVERHVHQQHDP